METKWMRFIEMSAQALALVSVWRSASAMVTSAGAIGEPLGLLHTLEPLAIPATVLAVMGSIAATQIRLRSRRKLRKLLDDQRVESSRSVVEAATDWREQVILDLRRQIAQLNEERERLNGLLQEKSLCLRKDPLTGVFNRLAYNEQLEQEFHRWQRFGNPLTFVIWDVDHFKQINDAYGHALGDEVLRHIAAQLSVRLRSTDFVARYGGEEFAMLLPGADAEAALQLAEQIRQNIAETAFSVGEAQIAVTISCGIASFEPGDSAQSVFKRADHALYRAKQTGRNSCRVG